MTIVQRSESDIQNEFDDEGKEDSQGLILCVTYLLHTEYSVNIIVVLYIIFECITTPTPVNIPLVNTNRLSGPLEFTLMGTTVLIEASLLLGAKSLEFCVQVHSVKDH